MLTAVDDYPLIDGAGRQDTFRGLPQTPPWNALVFALRSPTFRLTDLLKIDARAAAPLAAVSLPAIFDRLDHIDADTFLKSINFPEAARHLAFEVFSRSFFASPTDLSAAELATMFHIYFLGSSEGLVFDVVNANFDTALWNPLKQYLTELGVRFHQGVSVSSIRRQPRPGRFASPPMPTISWTPMPSSWPPTLPDCNGSSRRRRGSATTCGGHGSSGSAPPRRSWCTDCGSTARSPAGRAAFLGTSGHEPVDNISVLDRYERQAIDWARRTGGSVVELHSYAVESAQSNDAMLSQLHKLYPETSGSADRARTDAAASRLPALRAGDLRPSAQCRDSAAGAAAGRRRGTYRPTGGADGACGHYRLDGRQRDTAAMGNRRPRVVHGSHPGPLGIAAPSRRPREAFTTMNIRDDVRRRWPKDWPLQPIPLDGVVGAASDLPRRIPGDHQSRTGPVAAPPDG